MARSVYARFLTEPTPRQCSKISRPSHLCRTRCNVRFVFLLCMFLLFGQACVPPALERPMELTILSGGTQKGVIHPPTTPELDHSACRLCIRSRRKGHRSRASVEKCQSTVRLPEFRAIRVFRKENSFPPLLYLNFSWSGSYLKSPDDHGGGSSSPSPRLATQRLWRFAARVRYARFQRSGFLAGPYALRFTEELPSAVYHLLSPCGCGKSIGLLVIIIDYVPYGTIELVPRVLSDPLAVFKSAFFL